MHDSERTLTECQTGDEVDIVRYATETPLCGRLRELGLSPGHVVRVARAGSPMIVEVGASRLCLRGADASQLVVRPRQSVYEAVYTYAEFGAERALKSADPA
ncbi:MAG: hypothetical protein AMXMBFR84_09200 [Candidatus Hydrogenedentota bacterium]